MATNLEDPDEDYDHDGNSNPLEAYLQTNPLVGDSPISILGWSEGASLPAGVAQIQVQFTPGYAPVTLGLTCDGEDIPGVPEAETPLASPVTFCVDTARLPNGLHVFRPVALLDRAATASGMYLAQSVGAQLTLQVHNEISFSGGEPAGWQVVPPWEDDFTTVLQINAWLEHYPAEYKIEVFDSQDVRIFHTTGSQYSEDGSVDFEWDLLQDNGSYYSGELGQSVYAKITSYYPDEASYVAGIPGSGISGPVATPRSKYSRVDDYPWHGTWILAVQESYPDYQGESLASVFDVLAYAWDYVAQQDGNYALPLPYTYTRMFGEAFRIGFNQTTTQPPVGDILAHTADWNQMRLILPHFAARNLWLYSHGNQSAVGGDYDGVDRAIADHLGDSKLLCSEVKNLLGFGSGSAPNHYYRFVFLDGCSTAKGAWPTSFGIKKNKVVNQTEFDRYYKNRAGNFKRRPSAFCGWDSDLRMGARNSFATYRAVFRDAWLQAPPEAVSLVDALVAGVMAAESVDPSDPQSPIRDERMKWRVPVIFGYEGLRFDDYNWLSRR